MSAEIDRDRLARILGMLGSRFAGEVVAAARQAERLRREAGVTWFDVIAPQFPPPREPEIDNLDDAIEFALKNAGELTDWEVAFLRSLRRQRKPASEKQRSIVEQIFEKCRMAAGTAA